MNDVTPLYALGGGGGYYIDRFLIYLEITQLGNSVDDFTLALYKIHIRNNSLTSIFEKTTAHHVHANIYIFVIYLLFSLYISIYNKKSNNSNVLAQGNVDR